EVGALALQRRGADRESAAAASVRARRLKQGGWVLDRIAVTELVARGSDDQHAVPLRVPNRASLESRRVEAAEADVDDPGAVLNRVDDPCRLVNVRDRTVGVRDLDAHQLRVAPEAGDPLPVRDRARRK